LSYLAIARLFDGLLDVIGDLHGEIDPLRELLARLGYDAAGGHRAGRRLVFVGDLGDRGSDSPAVIEWVRELVSRGAAQCLLGNHELNLLRGELKPGNEWFMDPTHPRAQAGGEYAHSKPMSEALKPDCLSFFASLPMVLERPDLRVVHAAWLPGEIAALRGESGSIVDIYKRFEIRTQQQLEMEGVLQRASSEEAECGAKLFDQSAAVPLLTGLGEGDERYQMGSPVRVATSGVERMARSPFWSGGKWRMCERVNWWEEYDEPVPVIIGHYWRSVKPVKSLAPASSRPAAFAAVGPTEWVGLQKNVFCVDFSVGARYQERSAGATSFESHLAAMRWPERELWFECGRQP
jgi:hypothetical protein